MENINDITASKRAFYLEYFKYIFLTILAYMYFSYIFNAGDSLSLSLSLSHSRSPSPWSCPWFWNAQHTDLPEAVDDLLTQFIAYLL